uniref:Uncharacterized protein n=1 Tax=Varanus komodoensis TaxID=61221 RepID=A0A8D2J3T8_VARKO
RSRQEAHLTNHPTNLLPYLEKAMGEVCPEQKGSKNLARDSGYDSLPSKLSILDKLLHTHPVWLQLGLDDAEAADVLRPHPPGVRDAFCLKVLSLRLPSEFGSCLKEFAIKETFSLEGSGISFADLFRLIAFYCISRYFVDYSKIELLAAFIWISLCLKLQAFSNFLSRHAAEKL